MERFVALIRGINVGGRNLLPMKQLKVIMESIGCKNVQTYIQSGNVVFDLDEKNAGSLENQLQSLILTNHGFTPQILLIRKRRFLRSIENNPFPTEDGKLLHFFFCKVKPDNYDSAKLDQLAIAGENFDLIKDVFYLYAPSGIGRSKLAANVEKILNVTLTARNYNTIDKLNQML